MNLRATTRAVCVAAVLCGAWAASAQEPKASPAEGLKAYAVISQRNIFDPNRRRPAPPVTRLPAPPPAPPPAPAPPPPEKLRLSGTVVSRDATVALFDGSRAEYNVVVTVGGNVADLAVATISSDGVVLTGPDDWRMLLRVGSGLSRSHGAAWEPAEGIGPMSTGSKPTVSSTSAAELSAGTASTSAASSSTASAASGGASDLLKRLLERRKRESGK